MADVDEFLNSFDLSLCASIRVWCVHVERGVNQAGSQRQRAKMQSAKYELEFIKRLVIEYIAHDNIIGSRLKSTAFQTKAQLPTAKCFNFLIILILFNTFETNRCHGNVSDSNTIRAGVRLVPSTIPAIHKIIINSAAAFDIYLKCTSFGRSSHHYAPITWCNMHEMQTDIVFAQTRLSFPFPSARNATLRLAL